METLSLRILAEAAEFARENPSPEIDLMEQAEICQDAGDWEGAETVLQALLRRADDEMTRWRAHASLAGLREARGDLEGAYCHAASGVAAMKEVDLAALHVTALDRLASVALRLGRNAEARSAVDRAFGFLPDEGPYNLERAICHILRAACRLQTHDLDGAEDDLQAALPLLEPMSRMSLAAGVHSTLGRWWRVKAELHAARQQPGEACAALEQAVELCRGVCAMPHVSGSRPKLNLADALHHHALALRAVGEEQAAKECVQESLALRAAFNLPPLA